MQDDAHAYSVRPDPDSLPDLFAPGPGTTPPCLAGRTFQESVLENQCRAMLAGRPFKEAVLFGPRGNGKTVLLGKFEEGCRAAGAETMRLTPADMPDRAALARALLEPAPDGDGAGGSVGKVMKQALPDTGTMRLNEVRAGAPGLAGATWERLSPAELDASLKRLLTARCRRRPLVVTLDEAHTLDEAVGQRLLNLSQVLRGEGVPFLLVMAGTPGLRSRLNTVKATFWSRAARLGIGLLSPEAAREALEEPLSRHGVAFDPAALDRVVAESQRYPYFIQVWGEALCRVLVERDAAHIDAGIVEAARPAFEAERTDYYSDRYNELRKQRLLPAAEVVADLLGQADAWRPAALEKRLEQGLGLTPGGADDALERLSHLGYVWQDYGATTLSAGIPSLMTHVLAEAQADAAPTPGGPAQDSAPGP